MPIFVIPHITEVQDNELIEIANRAKIDVITVDKYKDLFPYILEGNNVIAQMDPATINLMVRNASDLLEILPSYIIGVPHAVYTRDFQYAVNTLPPEPFEVFRRRLAKSGTTANSVSKVSKEARSSKHSDELRLSSTPSKSLSRDFLQHAATTPSTTNSSEKVPSDEGEVKLQDIE